LILGPYKHSYSDFDYERFIVTFCSPIIDKDSNIIGVSGVDFDFQYLIKMLNHLPSSSLSSISIISDAGKYIYNSVDSLMEKSIDTSLLDDSISCSDVSEADSYNILSSMVDESERLDSTNGEFHRIYLKNLLAPDIDSFPFIIEISLHET
jgi:hypothetical protein